MSNRWQMVRKKGAFRDQFVRSVGRWCDGIWVCPWQFCIWNLGQRRGFRCDSEARFLRHVSWNGNVKKIRCASLQRNLQIGQSRHGVVSKPLCNEDVVVNVEDNLVIWLFCILFCECVQILICFGCSVTCRHTHASSSGSLLDLNPQRRRFREGIESFLDSETPVLHFEYGFSLVGLYLVRSASTHCLATSVTAYLSIYCTQLISQHSSSSLLICGHMSPILATSNTHFLRLFELSQFLVGLIVCPVSEFFKKSALIQINWTIILANL